MHEFVELVHAIAWPGVALTALLLLRSEIAALLRRTRQFKFKGLSVALDLAAEVAQAIPRGETVALSTGGNSARQDFDRLAAEYRDLKIEDLPERVAARRRLADRLGVLAVQLQLDRRTLSGGHEGERVALATACLTKPLRGDLTHLLAAATPPPGQRLYRFTGYRIVLALMPSVSRNVSKRQIDRAWKILDIVEERADADADESLQRLIDRTRALLDEARSQL